MLDKVVLRYYTQPWLKLPLWEERKQKFQLLLRHQSNIPDDALGARTKLPGLKWLDVWTNGESLTENAPHNAGSKRKWVDAFGQLTTQTFRSRRRIKHRSLDVANRDSRPSPQHLVFSKAIKVEITFMSDQTRQFEHMLSMLSLRKDYLSQVTKAPGPALKAAELKKLRLLNDFANSLGQSHRHDHTRSYRDTLSLHIHRSWLRIRLVNPGRRD